MTKSGAEVDFVVRELLNTESELIQVCWSMDNLETRRREETALKDAMKELNIKRGKIITWLDEYSVGEDLEIVPAWKWLLE